MKKAKVGSIESLTHAMENAAKGPPAVPKHCALRVGDKPFWDGVVCARARDDWSKADLVVAAQLARCQADIEREQLALDGEDTVVTNERGTLVVNARVSVLEQFARREMALMRTLRMGGRIAGDSREDAGRRKLQLQAEKLRDEVADEELLAT